jgi:hypothetical protein
MKQPTGKNSSVDSRIMVMLILPKGDDRTCTAVIWLRIGQVAGAFECGNEPLGSIK